MVSIDLLAAAPEGLWARGTRRQEFVRETGCSFAAGVPNRRLILMVLINKRDCA